jgi:hypothetical protein
MKTLIACLLMVGYLWTDIAPAHAEVTGEDVNEVAAMCAGIFYAGVTGSPPDVQDLLRTRAEWYAQWTTEAQVDANLHEMLNLIAKAIETDAFDEFEEVYMDGLQACVTLMDDSIANTTDE